MEELRVVGKSVPSVDALDMVTGKTKFSMDLKLPNMLHGKVLRSPHPHARIININTSKALQLSGVRAVVTGKDAPEAKVGWLMDRDVLARDVVRFVGEAVGAVAADTVEIAEEALELIEIDYEELPAVFDPEETMKSSPPTVIHPDLLQYTRTPIPALYNFEPDLPNVFLHRRIRKGDAEKGFQEADLVMENKFSLARIQHCPLEPHNAIAQPEPDGGLTVWLSGQSLYSSKRELCRLFKLSPTQVRVIAPYVGGAFGGKSAAGAVGADIAALLALKTGKPVKLVYTREEVFTDGVSREPMIIHIKDGVKRDGTLVAREMKLILNAGAYSGTTLILVKNAAFGAVGTYRVPNFKLDSYGVYTNEPATGPLRGFGTLEVIWAIECQMDMIAEGLGIDSIKLRKKNLLIEGDEDVCGMTTHSIGVRECLDNIAEWIEWDQLPSGENAPWKRGKGIAVGNKNTMAASTSVVNIKVHEDATIEVRHSVHALGQGANTVLAQMAAEEFNTSIDKIKLVFTDTAVTPYDHATVSSRSTFHAGNALLLACQNAKQQIFDMVSVKLEVSPKDLDIRDGVIYVKGGDRSIKISELFAPVGFLLRGGELIGSATYTGPIESEDIMTGQGKRVVTSYSHAANAAEVMVNTETGEVKVLRMGGAFDMGQPINPKLCEVQIEGGMAMGIGGALYEEMIMQNGVVANPNFLDYNLPSTTEIPVGENLKSIIAVVPHKEGPYGAKGLAEVTTVSVAPAIGNAIYNAVGVRINDLPITKEKILKAIQEQSLR
ncbi:xanthine dehydrogenase family protein molybdopterin-binding subunit [Chloroflexota bacterium]